MTCTLAEGSDRTILCVIYILQLWAALAHTTKDATQMAEQWSVGDTREKNPEKLERK